MELKDYYRILSITRDASTEEIKKAFRRLALQYHPDRNPESIKEAETKFKEINEAYEILGDGNKRWRYDSLINTSNYSRNMGLVAGDPSLRKPWGCGRRRGGQCRRQWRPDID